MHGVTVFIRTYAWVASCHQPPNSRGHSANLPLSCLIYTATSPFPDRRLYLAVPRFTAAKRLPTRFLTVG